MVKQYTLDKFITLNMDQVQEEIKKNDTQNPVAQEVHRLFLIYFDQLIDDYKSGSNPKVFEELTRNALPIEVFTIRYLIDYLSRQKVENL